jgi:hypothetical protein
MALPKKKIQTSKKSEQAKVKIGAENSNEDRDTT